MREEEYLKDMYSDPYFPDFLVDKIKESIKKIYEVLESGETDLNTIQEICDSSVIEINDLEDEFEDNDSEIETVARNSIAVTVEKILVKYNIDLDIEEALRERDW
ncbi:DUF5713 family protein [Vagococcus fluvialis]|jgi:DNA-binding PadR family transcriptional regulator|uniref:DUF5713 family protein n=1 Tax=Vagococcus fluvialis TaxID=2738 RepID=UPI00288D3AC3|nr:DUF5713 family protein [Vagococcus fluvialis]MDT2745867.1 DUF5713 family protein [Vagococcus fluvialis]